MPSSFHPPRQQRSAATLDRIVRAAQDLLAQRGYDAATVDDIVARAGSSKGSFYHRFADKEALLAYLGGECLARAKATWAERLDPERLRGGRSTRCSTSSSGISWPTTAARMDRCCGRSSPRRGTGRTASSSG